MWLGKAVLQQKKLHVFNNGCRGAAYARRRRLPGAAAGAGLSPCRLRGARAAAPAHRGPSCRGRPPPPPQWPARVLLSPAASPSARFSAPRHGKGHFSQLQSPVGSFQLNPGCVRERVLESRGFWGVGRMRKSQESDGKNKLLRWSCVKGEARLPQIVQATSQGCCAPRVKVLRAALFSCANLK